MIPDFTSTEENLLKLVAQAYQNGTLVTLTQVANLITNNGASLKSAPLVQEISIVSGVATIPRIAQITYAAIATEGGLASDILDTVTATGYTKGDRLVIFCAQLGVSITTSTNGNITALGHVWNSQDAVLELVYAQNGWMRLAGYPLPVSPTWNRTDQEIGTAPASITVTSNWLQIYRFDLGTETRATGTFTVTAASGTSGHIEAVVDNGSGVLVSLGAVTYNAATTDLIQAAALNAAINALTATHGYSSTVLGAVLTITAPIGSGASANTWSLDFNVSGGATASTVNFAGGVTAVYQASNLQLISGGSDGVEILITNISNQIITFLAGVNIHSSATGALAAGASRRVIYDSGISAWRIAA